MFFPEVTAAATKLATAIDRQTAAINRLNETLVLIGMKMDEALEKIRLQVEATATVQASAVAFIAGIVEELRKHAGEADKINALADQLAAGTQPLADAIAANP
jgi:hypothetical protein